MKKHKNEIGIFLIFFILFLAVRLNTYLNNLDELWNFNFARNIANGLLPYKDFNIITTPGVPILMGFVLSIFGTELIVTRIASCILGATIFVFIYKILNLFKINKYVNLLILFLYYLISIEYIVMDYNTVNFLIALVVLYFELKSYYKSNDIFDYNFKKDFLIGIFAGLSIWVKQTTGIFLSLCFVFYKILAIRKKEDFKKYLKIVATRLVGILIPIIALIIYLVVNNLVSSFLSYTIFGVMEFSNEISYLDFVLSDNGIYAILAPIIIIISFIKGVIKNDKLALVLFSFSIVTFIRNVSNFRFCTFYPFWNNSFNYWNISFNYDK